MYHYVTYPSHPFIQSGNAVSSKTPTEEGLPVEPRRRHIEQMASEGGGDEETDGECGCHCVGVGCLEKYNSIG